MKVGQLLTELESQNRDMDLIIGDDRKVSSVELVNTNPKMEEGKETKIFVRVNLVEVKKVEEPALLTESSEGTPTVQDTDD